jgi:hypothetical protein
MRAENKLEYMRSVLRQGVTDLKAKKDKDLIVVAEQVESNLKDAFARQDLEIGVLQAQVNKIVGKEIPITSAGFLAGFIQFPYGAIVSLLFAGRDIKKSLAEKAALETTISQKNKNFINLLLRSYERKD